MNARSLAVIAATLALTITAAAAVSRPRLPPAPTQSASLVVVVG